MIPREHIQEDSKRTFEEEFPTLNDAAAATNNKRKGGKARNNKNNNNNPLATSTESSINNSDLSASSGGGRAKSPQVDLTNYIDFSDGTTDSWKKRDLLYYCFVQRHHEVRFIAEFIEEVVQMYHLPTNNLLDIGCGLGRMFSEWEASKWDSIDAVEPDADYFLFSLDHARHTCEKVTVHNFGFQELCVQEKYNLITSINGPFQYLTRLEERLIAMRNMYNALTPGGVLIIDVSNFLGGLAHMTSHTAEQMKLVNGVPVKRVSNVQVDFHNAIWSHNDIFFSVDGGESDPDGLGTGYGDGSYVVENRQFSILTLPELQFLYLSSGFINILTTSKYCSRSLRTGMATSENEGSRIIVIGQKPK
ncbi:hypothetical protein SAMD00019534_076990 [Acytostelium subglobosum LB1]|uniref:hypothetical protein n=1 Tax=Acytostelium subglobosum LB1 TaxID=1410327 RepID=UPI0006450F1D|nr:hypothetical protein SAMD00019534_076990 [Acytostelium subglobosum LB1]GAM24524.1 hypothetical protein SAMD00019534_076990 [Acytostelium subglobosum LB1]|eukprot:XP_012752850.1 hypothetical protein SAMD00019534_076990 [Acytostelium subglobosum LB1]